MIPAAELANAGFNAPLGRYILVVAHSATP